MATSIEIISRAMRLLGVYDIGETIQPEESNTGLVALNGLIGSLANSGNLVFSKSTDSISLVAGTASYTIGPSGGTVSTRPVDVLDESYVAQDGVSYPLDLINLQQYNDIGVKAIQGIPRFLMVSPGMPNITITLYPVPDQAMTLSLVSNKPILGTLELTTELSLPPGYDRLLAFLLAEDIAPEFAVDVPRAVAATAAQARRYLKRTNLEVPQMSVPRVNERVFVDIREM